MRAGPLDGEGLRALVSTGEIVVVEPYAKGTSAHLVGEAVSL